MAKVETENRSINVDKAVQMAVKSYCVRRGLVMQVFVENVLRQALTDKKRKDAD